MKKHASLLTVFLAVSLALGLANVEARAASNCKLVLIDEWPVKVERNKLLVDGEINGEKIKVILDTGFTASMVPRSFATRLGLPRERTRRLAQGVGETLSYVDIVYVRELKIHKSRRTDYRAYMAGERDLGANIGFVLGEDFLAQFDVEFDLSHNALRLFQTKDCRNESLAYWASDQASVLPIDKVSDFVPQISLTIEVNGRPIRAQLDSGAANSVLAKSAAALVGVTPETPGVVNIGKLVGIGRDAIDVWMAPVESIVIGNEKISDTTILFADLYDTAWPNRHPMLLGVDFLLSHRVLVAHSQRQIYFTYAGGPVFQRIAVPGLPSASGGRSADR